MRTISSTIKPITKPLKRSPVTTYSFRSWLIERRWDILSTSTYLFKELKIKKSKPTNSCSSNLNKAKTTDCNTSYSPFTLQIRISFIFTRKLLKWGTNSILKWKCLTLHLMIPTILSNAVTITLAFSHKTLTNITSTNSWRSWCFMKSFKNANLKPILRNLDPSWRSIIPMLI